MANINEYNLTEGDWKLLLERIRDGKCTPFLGAGACYPILPLGSNVAEKWAQEYHYPLKDSSDLVRVAQFLAVDKDPMYPKEQMKKLLNNNNKLPDFNANDEIHGILADLPLPIYITTNYDDFMVQALKSRKKNPKREFCRWSKNLNKVPSIFKSKPDRYEPTFDAPVVFHFHGCDDVAESIVITRDDYLDFLVNINRDQKMIPPRIVQAFGGSSLLFLGYGIEDWTFRVVFRHVYSYMDKSIVRTHVSVQIAPGEEYLFSWDKVPGEDKGRLIEFLKNTFSIDWVMTAKVEKIDDGKTIKVSTEKNFLSLKLNDEKTKVNLRIDDDRTYEFIVKMESGKFNIFKVDNEQKEKAIEYLNKYFTGLNTRVYWGTCSQFAKELRRRWEEFSK